MQTKKFNNSLEIVQLRLILFLIISAVGIKPGCEIELLRGGVRATSDTHSPDAF